VLAIIATLAGRIPIAVKSGKDKTGYMLFGTRWKEGRDGLTPYGIAQVFVRFFPTTTSLRRWLMLDLV
jgi:hypothetical protein